MSFTLIVILLAVFGVIFIFLTGIAVYCLCSKSKKRSTSRHDSYLQPVSARNGKDKNYMETVIPVEDDGAGRRGLINKAAADDNLTFDFNALLSDTIHRAVKQTVIDADRLTLEEAVGQGKFGVVYRGLLRDKNGTDVREVAVKTVQGDECSQADVSAFMDEVFRMRGFAHRNVLCMLGLVMKAGKPYVVLPYMEKGDLKSYVSLPSQEFTIRDLLDLGSQVASGMAYLAEQGFVHRDLAARNCMINKDIVVKVADFGLSRDIFTQDYYVMQDLSKPMPIKWMALESLNSQVFNEKSDVWSYGILLWEVMTRGKTPYPGMDNLAVVDYVKSGHRLVKPSYTPDEIFNLMMNCWEERPADRPTFQQLQSEMNKLLNGRIDGSSYQKLLKIQTPNRKN